MEALSANTTSAIGKPQVSPIFHVGGDFRPNIDKLEDYMLSGMALSNANDFQETFALTQSQNLVTKEAPHGASPTLDPQHRTDNRQA